MSGQKDNAVKSMKKKDMVGMAILDIEAGALGAILTGVDDPMLIMAAGAITLGARLISNKIFGMPANFGMGPEFVSSLAIAIPPTMYLFGDDAFSVTGFTILSMFAIARVMGF